MIRLWWAETVRLVGRKRWLALFPAFILATLVSLSTLHSLQLDIQLDVNVWDGVFGTLFSWLYFRFIILLLFIFLVTDSVLEDIASNWVWLTLSRSSGRLRWWTAKVISLFTAGLIYFLLGLIIVFLVSLFWLPYEPALSQFAIAPSNYSQGVGPIVLPAGTSPFVLCGQFLLYSAFAVSIFVLIPVTLSLAIRQAYLVPLIPFTWVFLSHFWLSNRFLFRIDLIPRLFYGVYFSSGGAPLMDLSASLLYLSLVGIGFYSLGAYMVNRVDF